MEATTGIMHMETACSKQMAFAYFIYQKDKILSEMAEKRLQGFIQVRNLKYLT